MPSKDEEIVGLLSKMLNEQAESRHENTVAFANLDKKVDLHIQRMEFELDRINKQDEVQNFLLDKHIEGVNTLKRIHDSHVLAVNARFAKIEEPSKWRSQSAKLVLKVGAIATALAAILALFKSFM